MVRALLAGTKTQTRRRVKLPVIDRDFGCELSGGEIAASQRGTHRHSPYGQPGDRLWVRENFCWHLCCGHMGEIAHYQADGPACPMDGKTLKWKPSIYCTRAASRITLEIVSVRAERLNEISEADAEAEGAHRKTWITSTFGAGALNATSERGSFRDGYKEIWESINGAGSWALNLWVWVIEFRRVAQ